MIKINGKTLIERQIQVLEAVGINNIVIVTGYNSEMINYKGLTTIITKIIKTQI